jgi:DNA polymerase III delta prime subunit
MAVTNFPYTQRPRKLSEVWYQDVTIDTIKKWLRADRIPSSICFFGDTGVGKTATAKLLVQATHCLNRAPGKDDACGNCAVCNSDPQYESGYGNVVWVAAQNSKDGDNKEITYQAAIVEALHQADRGPFSTGRPHADVLYIVFEEAHLLPKNLFQRCLARSDAFDPIRDKVVLVFISMSVDQLDDRARQAISQRGAILELSTPTQLQIATFIHSKFKVKQNVAETIACIANGSLRGALTAYQKCADLIEPVTIESASIALETDRLNNSAKLWRLITSTGTAANFRNEMSSALSNLSPERVVARLQDDLDAHFNLVDEQIWWTATLLLSQVAVEPNRFSLNYCLLNLRNLKWPPAFIKATDVNQESSFVARLLQESWENLHYGC